MKIATWNINSIRIRLKMIAKWLEKENPDFVAFQEIKTEEKNFPKSFFEDKGYNVQGVFQKTYNGVACISKEPINVIDTKVASWDKQSRYINVCIKNWQFICLYEPNGNPIDNKEKFEYKLRWQEALLQKIAFLKKEKTNFLVMGDFNVVPRDEDCHDPREYTRLAGRQPEVLKLWQKILKLGLVDVIEKKTINEKNVPYTYWSYLSNDYKRNRGLRVDHLIIPKNFLSLVKDYKVDKEQREVERPSDHAPVIFNLNI